MALGKRRARHDALGLTAVNGRSRALSLRAAVILLPLLASGCTAAGGIAGAVAGASTGAVTANPVVGYAVAVGVNAGVDELQKYIARVRQTAEQDAIVQAVGTMDVGTTRPWKIVHDIPMFDNEHGEMQVARSIDTPLAECKEVVFTIDGGGASHPTQTIYVTSACRDTEGWKWAGAEPATDRWGFFQHISH